jgi:uncharacterized protein YjbI with pentapeptide repeats
MVAILAVISMKDDNGSGEELTEIPASEILDKIQKGKPVEYDHIRIVGNLNLHQLNLPLENTGKKNCEIKRWIPSHGCKVIMNLPTEYKTINSSIKITDSEFKGDLFFYQCKFLNDVCLSKSSFCGIANFRGAAFSGDANFRGAAFSGNDVKGAAFSGISFKSLPIPLEVFEKSDFIGTTFRKDAHFEGATFYGDVYFIRATFSEWTDFTGATFRESADFEGASFGKNTYFEGALFSGDLLSFKNAIFNNPRSQEVACRTAKILLEKKGDREEAGSYFYREMEGNRKQKSWYIRYPEWFFIQFIFGYGVHPFRLMACWLGFVGLFAVIYMLWNAIDPVASQLPGNATIADYVWFSIATATTPGYAGYKPTSDFKWVAGLEAIFGTFMWAAFIATFSRKYMK